MVKQIVWTKTARQQRQSILEYWANRNGNKKYSKKISALVRTRIKFISDFNILGKETNFKDIRVTTAGHFSIFYKLTSEKILIMSLWDNRQNPDKLVEILK